ncbi:MAG: metal ABC transporter ATP-binding protein [Thermoleophilia bacterium]|nr:metal ABC transporter ATP-binding protein [Thermoleophilia bacterium]
MMNEPIIELENVSFSYNHESAIRDISLKFEKGSYDGIVGPNGGGKTTLLKIILGLLKPTAGRVRLFGQNIERFRDWSRIGYLPQKVMQTDVRFPVTVREVVSQGRFARAGLFRRLSASDMEAVDRSLEISGASHLKNRLISELSGGERQRVFIARALASEPEVLVLDEPATGIDVASQDKFYRFLKRLNQEFGITIIFVSHDIDILMHEASRLICINHRLVCAGSASLIFKENQNLLESLYGEHAKHIAAEHAGG